MAQRRSQERDQIRLSPEAMLAAERLAEIAGLPAADLLEVVLLELAESGAAVQAGLSRNRAIVHHSWPTGGLEPAKVIPIERGRRGRGPEPGPHRWPRRPRVAATRGRADGPPHGEAAAIRHGDGDG